MTFKQIVSILSLSTLTLFVSCKPKDSELQKTASEVLSISPGVDVVVKDGVATLSGTVENAAIAAAAKIATEKIKGIKSVTNNVTVTPLAVSAPSVDISPDNTLSAAVSQVTKDFPGITTSVAEGVISVRGELSSSKWKTLKMALDALQPKKVDAKELIIK